MKVILRRFLPQFCILIIICIISGVGYAKSATKPVNATADMRHTVIIDAGHGGFDGGAVASDGTVEKDINLKISKNLRVFLELNGFNVIMTRTEDTGTENIEGTIAKRKKSDLQNRLKLMSDNPDAIYVSVHLNKFTTPAANGAQVFYTPNFDEAKELGGSVQDAIVSLIQQDNKRVIKKSTSSTYILHNAKVPAIIVECGFLSNSQELKLLKDEEYQSKMSFAIAHGIMDYYEN